VDILYKTENHCNVMFSDLGEGFMVQSTQHLISHGKEAIILDPGGHKIYSKLLAETSAFIPIGTLKHLFFSHQDPDIVAAANGWLMMTDAQGYISALWHRFLPHFGVDRIIEERIKTIPEEGMQIDLDDLPLQVIPAPFLHSPGNFQVYDPVSKLLYTGDLGASFGAPYVRVEDFDAHIPYMEGFHQRYIPVSKAFTAWRNRIENLDIAVIAPQHGAIFPSRDMAQRFIEWTGTIRCYFD
jgi:flavorubredoxin